MAKAAAIRVRTNETADVGGVRVTNRTGNSILVRTRSGGIEVTQCCLEEMAK